MWKMANALKEIEHAQRLCDRGDITIGEYFDLVEKWEDAEPTKHGRWACGCCSECGYVLTTTGLTPYCPNCGARMDAQIGEDKSHPFAESVMMGMDGGENDS